MNELIKLKNKYKYKQYNRIPPLHDKTIEIIHNIMNDIINQVIKEQCCESNTNTIISPKIKQSQYTIPDIRIQPYIEEHECRICFEEETVENQFIWPCRCKGTSKHVHNSCLERWRYENMNNPAFEICMECRYKYRFKHQYPYEFHSQVEINGCFLIAMIHILPLMFSYVMSQIDYVNSNIILKTVLGSNNSLIRYIDLNPTSTGLSYCMYYNMVLYAQSILFVFLYLIYVCKFVYRKKQYFKLLIKDKIFCFFFLFRYPLLYQISMDNISWLTIFVTISTIYIFLDPVFYKILLKKHNSILFKLDIDNSFSLRNYVEEDDFEQEQQRRLQRQMQRQRQMHIQIEEIYEDNLPETYESP